MKNKLVLLIVMFCCLAVEAKATTLGEINNLIGAQVIYGSGGEGDLSITTPESGLYVLKRNQNQFSCTPGFEGCEPDKYEVRIPEKVNHIFGLGMQSAVDQVEIEDFLDTSFSFGHYAAKKKDGTVYDQWAHGSFRLRTPIFVLPSKGMILAYFQPEVKILRLTRNGESGCPVGNTCMVMKKHPKYPEGSPADMIIIKKNTIAEAYGTLNRYLKSKGQYFKDPSYVAFGNNWETYMEYECWADKNKILEALERYKKDGVALSTVTMGSGYWQVPGLVNDTGSVVGCSGAETGLPATDSLMVNDARYGGLSGINNFYSELINQWGAFPVIGMRQRIQMGNDSYNNIDRISQLFRDKAYLGDIYLKDKNGNNGAFYASNGVPHLLLNTYDENNTETWVKLLKENYGGFKGIKHDDMSISDQRAFYSANITKYPNLKPSTINIADDYSTKIFKTYADGLGKDSIIFTNNDWFSQGSDGQENDGILNTISHTSLTPFRFKQYVDSALTRTSSGYTNTMNFVELGFGYKNGKDITDPAQALALTRISQLITFYPVTLHSAGYWHLKNSNGSDDVNKQSVVAYFMRLRQRLQQYAYDQAKNTYVNGIPQPMKPLFIDYPQDEEVYKQYSYLSGVSDNDNPRDEFMFGNALLIRPVFNNSETQKIYFPEGKWLPLIGQTNTKGKVISRGYVNYTMPNLDGGDRYDFPVFLKEGQILLIGQEGNVEELIAYVFFDQAKISSIYNYYPRDGVVIKLQASVENGSVYLKNLSNGNKVMMVSDNFGKGFRQINLSQVISGDTNNEPSISPTISPSVSITTAPNCGGVMEECCTSEPKCGEELECSGSNRCLKVAPPPVT
ncbi:MAG: hypothetical protein WCT01_05410, partial [Candidatus Shapirobacteria bacterium]